MTLAEMSSAARGSLPHTLEPWLWPSSTRHIPGGDLSIGGVSLLGVAAEHGTPCYVVDTGEFRARCATYCAMFHDADVAYAGKALLTRAVARMVDEQGLLLDICSAGELAVAVSAGFPVGRLILHGNAKSTDLLRRVVRMGVGRIVIDNFDDVAALAGVAGLGRTRQRVLVRVTPGVDAHTHRAITTGTEAQKFGLSISTGDAAEAVRRVLATPGLELVGVHCHLGSQIATSDPYQQAVTRLVGFLAAIRDEHDLTLPELNLGGGHAIVYQPGDIPLVARDVAAAVRQALTTACHRHRLPRPRLTIEPGRAIAGPAGITLYRVRTVKHAGDRTWVAVDGGMSDNPRPAMYGARYIARLLGRLSGAADQHLTIVGQHCEAGDVLIEDVLLPADVHRGDLLVVPATGAYHYSMASNYNLIPRPPLVGVADGRSTTLVRRETTDDLLHRDLG